MIQVIIPKAIEPIKHSVRGPKLQKMVDLPVILENGDRLLLVYPLMALKLFIKEQEPA